MYCGTLPLIYNLIYYHQTQGSIICERVVWCISVALTTYLTATHNILHVCNVYVDNKESLWVIQIHAVAVRVERPVLYISPCASLIFPAFARLPLWKTKRTQHRPLPQVKPSLILSCIVACLLFLAMVSVLFWKYLWYLCSLQVAKQLETEEFCKSCVHVVR